MWPSLPLLRKMFRDAPCEQSQTRTQDTMERVITQKPVNWRKPDISPDALERDVEYALKIGNEYTRLLETQKIGLKGATILELGPGHNYGAVLVLACHGANAVVADRFPVSWLEGYHDKFYELLWRRLVTTRPEIDTTVIKRCVELSGTHEAVLVVNSPAENLVGVADGSIDIILSNAVLEHVRSPCRVALEMHRITRPGGIGIHQIDFRDHRDFSRPLEYLLLGSDDFEKMFAERNGECGRQTRHFEMREFFRNSGFDVTEFDANWIAPDEYLDEFISRLQESSSIYKTISRDELRIISGRFTLCKSANS